MDLGKQIHELDNKNALNPSKDTYKKILQLRFEYNKIVSNKINKIFLFVEQKYFEFGECHRHARLQHPPITAHSFP